MSYHKEDIGICTHIVEQYYKPNDPTSTYNLNKTVQLWVDFSRNVLYTESIKSNNSEETNANT
jgi:hypothetical protein